MTRICTCRGVPTPLRPDRRPDPLAGTGMTGRRRGRSRSHTGQTHSPSMILPATGSRTERTRPGSTTGRSRGERAAPQPRFRSPCRSRAITRSLRQVPSRGQPLETQSRGRVGARSRCRLPLNWQGSVHWPNPQQQRRPQTPARTRRPQDRAQAAPLDARSSAG